MALLNPEKNTQSSFKSKIIENIQIANNVFKMTLDTQNFINQARPGQFISILCENSLLRRPFSIADFNKPELEIIYKIKGNGTTFLSKKKSGENIDILGPLGNSFIFDKSKSLLIGAGVGIAPLIYLSEVLNMENIEHKIIFASQEKFLLPYLDTQDTIFITENGSKGHKGRLTDYLNTILKNYKPNKIYACGPDQVLKILTETAINENIEINVALEQIFACGIGVCMGCSRQIKQNNEILSKRVCKDGPVFNGKEIIW